MRNRCSLKTFSLGFREWLTEKFNTGHTEAIVDTFQRTNGLTKPALSLAITGVVLCGAMTLIAAASRSDFFRGSSTLSYMASVTILSYGVILGLFYYFTTKFLKNLLKFCAEMCERGHVIEARQILSSKNSM